MRFLATVNRNKQHAVDVTVDGTVITYQVRKAFPTASLGGNAPSVMQVDGVDVHGPLNPQDADPSLLSYESGAWSVFGPAGSPVKLDLAAIRNYPDFSDCASFNFFWDYDHLRLERLPGFGEVGSYRLLENVQPFNVFAMSRDNKFTNRQCATLFLHTKPMGTIIVPFKDAPVEDWIVVFNMLEPTLLRISSGEAVEPTISLDVARYDFLPRIAFDDREVQVAADGAATIGFGLTDALGAPLTNDAEIHFESTGGYLPRSRISIVDGRGTVRVVARDLVPGETFKVKAGFKYFSGVDECLVRVV